MQNVIRQDLIRVAKEQFCQHNEVEVDAVRPGILASWERSRDFGIDPGQCDTSVLPTKALEKRIRMQQDFYDIAVPLLESLFAFTAGSGLLIVLADAEGYVLTSVGDDDIQSMAVLNGLVNGCNRSERRTGTNAIGTALEIGRPVQVSGHEHFVSPQLN